MMPQFTPITGLAVVYHNNNEAPKLYTHGTRYGRLAYLATHTGSQTSPTGSLHYQAGTVPVG
jgi:hypothetical protein